MSRCIAHIVSSQKEADHLLLRHPHCRVVEISAQLLDNVGITGAKKESLDREYLDLVAGLARQDGSKFWWANALSEKNELLSKFYARLMTLYAFGRWLERNPQGDCIVVCDEGLCGPVRDLLAQGRRVSGGGCQIGRLIRFLRNICRYLVKLQLLFWKEFYRMNQSRRFLKIDDRIRSLHSVRVVKSWIDHRCYRSGSFQDAYFPNLLPYLREHKVPYVILADIIQDFRKRLKDIVTDCNNLIVPIEYFFSPVDLIKAVLAQWLYRPQLRKKVMFGALDVTELVRSELDECFFSARFFSNLLYYFKIRGLARNVDMHSFIYTFENYAWEKMCLLALKESGRHIKTIGFQHAFIAKNSFRYMLGADEIGAVPSPDRILTMGNVTKRILVSYGRWPQERLLTGCALRQSKTMDAPENICPKSRDILVAFSMTREDSIKILEFIFAAGLDQYPQTVYLRFHPQTPVEEVLKSVSFKLPSNFVISTAASLNEDIKRAGVVLYTFTTVGLEALLNGLPVIYLDVNKPMDLDPLFECTYLKERAGDPRQLRAMIDGFHDLPEPVYAQALAKARVYLKDYFQPVQDDALALFAQ